MSTVHMCGIVSVELYRVVDHPPVSHRSPGALTLQSPDPSTAADQLSVPAVPTGVSELVSELCAQMYLPPLTELSVPAVPSGVSELVSELCGC